MEKKVTVVVPVYNADKHLARCLSSLAHQTLYDDGRSPYSIMVIDDGSHDASLTIAREFQEAFPDLFLVVTRTNQGAAATRNEGIARCTTPYIMFVDNDDYVESDYIERHLNKILDTHADIVISGYRRENQSRTLFQVRLHDSSWSKYQCVAPWARIFRTDFLRSNHIVFLENNIGEDTIFSLKAYQAADAIYILDYIGYVWYYNEASASNTLQKGLKEECHIVDLLDAMNTLIRHEDSLGEYYLYRYVVWYLLFSGKDASSERFCKTADELYSWLASHKYKLAISFWNPSIKTEPLRRKLIVSAFDKLYRSGTLNIFARLYCKGKS